MRKNNKGFALVETLLVSVFILTTLIFLFVQFRSVKQSFDESFNYDTVSGMYAASNFANFLKEENFSMFTDALNNECSGEEGCTRKYYVELTSCSPELFAEPTYCHRLKENLGIDQIFFSRENLNGLLNYLKSEDYMNDENPDISRTTKNYLETVAYDEESIRYRVILTFYDGTYASLGVSGR